MVVVAVVGPWYVLTSLVPHKAVGPHGERLHKASIIGQALRRLTGSGPEIINVGSQTSAQFLSCSPRANMAFCLEGRDGMIKVP